MSLLLLPGIASPQTTPSPTVTGGTNVGDTLQATPDTPGDQIDWRTCNADGSVLGATLSTATTSYTLQENDLTTDVCAVETTQDASPATLISASQGPISDTSKAGPSVSGTATVGRTLTDTPGHWGVPQDSIDREWLRCTTADQSNCSQISNVTGTTYELRPIDAGDFIEVQETPVYGGIEATNATQISNQSSAVASGAPTVAGQPHTGQTLTATPVFGDSTVQWFTCPSGNPTAQLTTTASLTYTVQETDLNHQLCAVETTSDSATLVSDPTAAVTDPAEVAPLVGGTATVGQTLSAGNATWGQGPGNIAYQWERCSAGGTGCVAITTNATSQTYQLRPADAGHAVEVQETPIYSGIPLSAATQTSPPTGPVASADPTVAGAAVTGGTLTATPVFGDSTIQWEACTAGGTPSGTPLSPGGLSYVIKETDFGTHLCAVESTSDGATLVSDPTATVTDTHQTPPTFSGTPTEGQALTAQDGGWGVTPDTINYQWQRCNAPNSGCAPISGATSQRYVLRPADVTKTIEVQETPAYGGTAVPGVAQTSTQQNIVGSAAPAVSGTANTGQMITATPVFSDSTSINWFQCVGGNPTGQPLNTSSSLTYVIRETDLDDRLCAVETTSDSPPVTIDSTPDGPVGDPMIAPVGYNGQNNEAGTLTASLGTWGQVPSVIGYQWFRCPNPPPAHVTGCTSILGATANQYSPVAADVGQVLEVQETPEYGGIRDTNPAVIETSQLTEPVRGPVPQTSNAPAIAGTPSVGDTLSESHASWSAGGDLLSTPAVQWQRGNTAGGFDNIPGATAQTYTLTAADLGLPIRVIETDTNVQDPNNPVVSSQADTNTIGPIGEATTSTVPPSISGTAQVGQTLSASPGAWNPSPSSITFAYQWLSCAGGGCSAIAGATGSTYNPSAADIGHALAVQVTPVIFSTVSPSQQSAQTVAVTAAPLDLPHAPVNVGPPAISGTASQNATLTAAPGSWANAPTGFAYQWMVCPQSGGICTPIRGATSPSFVPATEDVGHPLAVTVSATNAGGTGPAVSSARTGVVTAATLVQIRAPKGQMVAGATTPLSIVVTSGSPAVAPTGAVTVTRGGKAVHGCSHLAVKGKGQSVTVHCVARLDAGKDPLKAVFTPTGGRALAVPAPVTRTLKVARAQTTVVLNAPTRARPNAKITYTASVESTAGQTPARGRVVFEDRGHPIAGCQLEPIKDGTATCSLSYALSGRHLISAHFVAGGNFAASTSGPTPERIAEPRAVGAIAATINWTFHFTPHFTSINALVLHGAAAGSTLTMRCSGKGCPFHLRRLRIRHSAAAVNLDRGLRGQHLGIHAKVVITITRPRFVGKYYRFTIRPRKAPKIVIDCLALGSHTPGAGCTRS